MTTSVVSAQMSASRAANASRPGRGPSSRPSCAKLPARASAAGGAMLDLDDGAGAQAHQLLRGTLEAHAHRKALRNPHPVHRSLDIRDGARQIDPLLIEDAPADALHPSFDRTMSIDHRVGRGAVADGDLADLGLAEIGDGIPRFTIDQREQRL